jgi:DNA-binding protein H-NS
MVTVAELLEQKAALEKQIAEVQREERSSAISQIRTLMQQYNLSPSDFAGRGGGAGPKVAGSRAGRSVAAKYRDPESGKTWSGRGLKPRWLRDAIANGKSATDFAI